MEEEILYVDMGGSDCGSVQPGPVKALLVKNLDDSIKPLVVVSKEQDGDGHLTGSFWCSLGHPYPETVATVSVLSPSGHQVEMEYEVDDAEKARWEGYMGEVAADKIDELFPNGIYAFKVKYLNGTTATGGAVHAADYPSFYPVITAPAHGALVDPGSNLTVTWQTADDSVDGIAIDIGDQLVTHWEPAITQHTHPADMLVDNMRYDIWLAFGHDAPKNFGSKNLVATPDFFTGSRLVESWLGLVKAQAPSGNSGMLFLSYLESIGVDSANLVTADGETIAYVYDEYGSAWKIEVMTTEAQAALRFPDGSYQLGASFASGADENRTIQLAGSFPQYMPAIISPANRTVVDKYAPTLDIHWGPWPGGTGIVSVEIEKIEAIPADDGFEPVVQSLVWENYFNPDVTQVSIPTRLLDPASAFQLAVMFVNPNETGGYKVTRRHVFFQTNCNLEVSHTRMGFYPQRGSDAIAVSAGDCFSWSANSNASWIKITAGATGTGNGAVACSVSNNWGKTPREGSLTIAGETVKVYQQASQTTGSLDGGYDIGFNLWARVVLKPTWMADVPLRWHKGGESISSAGDTTIWGYFYAHPNDFPYGSTDNPEVFVKAYIAKSGWANIAFNHVTVDAVDVFSAHNYNGIPDQDGSITLDGRLEEHSYDGVK